MEWINSEGGPLIIIGAKRVKNWSGIQNDDYDRACAVDDYLGVIDVSNSQAIVLGDEPCQTSVYHSQRLGMLIVRWLWADSEMEVKKSLELLTIEDFDTPEEEAFFEASDCHLILFDAVSEGANAVGLSLELNRTKYKIVTINFATDDSCSLIVHRFIPI